jgi:protocatechuate 3,4-dioxygenase beta subunit
MKCLLILISAALLAIAFQDKPDEQAKPAVEEKKASIEGTVVDAASGRPLKDVSVMSLRTTADGSRTGATTDETGHYILKNLEAGRHMLLARHPRYALRMYGSRSRPTRGTPLTLAAGQTLKGIDFNLQLNAVISGKVVDEEGEPLKDVMVCALTSTYQRGRRQYAPTDTATTNDLGEFRVSNIAEGKYLVVAIPTKQEGGKPAEDGTEPAYLPTFYPNSSEALSAAPVTVSAGTEAGGTDIQLIKVKAVRVKGKVRGMTAGQRLSVRLFQKNAGMLEMMSARGGVVKPADGSFEITAVTPGSYVLRVMDLSAFRSGGVTIPLEVGDKPISGVTVEVVTPPDLSGEIVFDGEASQKPSFQGQRIMLEAIDGGAMPSMTNAAQGGTFQLKEVSPGKYFVRVMPIPEGSYVSSVTLGSQRMGDEGLEIGTAGGAKLEIKLRPGAAQVEGTVQDAEGKPVSGAGVALIPKSKSHLLHQFFPTDQNGAFRFKTVTPEDYLLLAVEDSGMGDFFDPEFLKLYESKGEKITLKENDRKGVALKLIPKE